MRGRVIWGDISRSVNGKNVLGGVAYKNKYISHLHDIQLVMNGTETEI